MDGRGPMKLKSSIQAHLDAIKWHAENDIPVEILESHHWSLRDAKDEVAIAAGFLGAYICKKLGVRNFISQYMFNTPPQTNQRDDLAKMLAQKEMIESLQDDTFTVYTQTRTGLFSYPIDLDMAKGQLAQSTMLQMQLNPHIIHVVSYSEANHAATPENVIESCKIANQVITKCLEGQPAMIWDPYVLERKQDLIEKAEFIVNAIKSLEIKCEKCQNGDMVYQDGRFGPFLGCNQYFISGCRSIMHFDDELNNNFVIEDKQYNVDVDKKSENYKDNLNIKHQN